VSHPAERVERIQDGRTSWTASDAEQLIPMLKSNPTTL
jgi:hypothetical protein